MTHCSQTTIKSFKSKVTVIRYCSRKLLSAVSVYKVDETHLITFRNFSWVIHLFVEDVLLVYVKGTRKRSKFTVNIHQGYNKNERKSLFFIITKLA